MPLPGSSPRSAGQRRLGVSPAMSLGVQELDHERGTDLAAGRRLQVVAGHDGRLGAPAAAGRAVAAGRYAANTGLMSM